MAALNRPTEATYVTHEEVTVDTTDREDHTFCGIMFPIKCKDLLPLDHVVIHSVAVRGRLGPLTVWISKDEDNETETEEEGEAEAEGIHLLRNDNNNTDPARRNRHVAVARRNNNNGNTKTFRMHPRYWTKVYERRHGPSYREYVDLDLCSTSVNTDPIVLRPGQTRAIYVHSTLPGDEAIVYDNRKADRTYDDDLVRILTGRAHVSCIGPFHRQPIWGWGNPWRDEREFVGRLRFGAVFRLWNPSEHLNFGSHFQRLAKVLFLCQRRWESPWSMLPDECIFYILNMCRWDWANDSQADMKVVRKKNKARNRQAAAAAAAAEGRRRAQEEERQQQQQRLGSTQVEGQSDVVMVQDNDDGGVFVTRESSSMMQQEQDDDDDDDDDDGSPRSCCNRRTSEATDTANREEDGDDYDEYHAAREDEAFEDDDGEYEEEIDEDFEDEFEEEDAFEEDDDDDEEEEESDEEDWDPDDEYRRANVDVFEYQDDDSDDDENNEGRATVRDVDVDHGRAAWLRRIRGIHMLHALAAMDDH